MNKIIASFLIICLLFQITVFAEGESDSVTDEISTESAGYVLSEDESEKLDFMQTIGVLTDINEEDISSNRNITRGDLAKAVVGLYGNRYENYSSTETIYNDVEESSDCYNAVNLLHELNIVSGYGDGSFKPENDINLNEAVKIITSVMGYTMVAEQKGGFPSGYMAVASECDILKGVKIDNVASVLKVSQLIPIIYNALEAKPLIQIMFTSDGLEYKMTEDETLLSIYFDIYKGKGIVTGNEYTSLLGKKKAGIDSIYIDDYEYLDINNISEGYLGYRVQFYYRDSDEEDDDVLVWLKPDAKSKVVEIFTDDIIEEKTTAYSIGYEDENRARVLQLKEDVSVIYNGMEYSGFTADLFNNADGKFIAISWDGSSEYDVLIVKDYDYYIVESVNISDYIVKDKFGRILECTIDDEPDDVIIEDVDGNPVELANLIEWETLAVEKSLDNSCFKITVLRNYVQGEISSYKSGVIDGSLTIDGKEYEISKNYPDVYNDKYPLDYVIGADTFVVLDLNNKVILVDPERVSMKYGIVTKIYKDEDENLLYAKIMNDKGIFTKFTLADRVKIDGKNHKIENDDSYDKVILALQQGDLITSLKEGESWTQPSDYVMQLIRYTLNDEDQICEIDTAKENSGQNPNQLLKLYNVNTAASRGVSMMFKTNDHTFNKVMATGANTKVFFVPSPINVTNEDDYAVESHGYFANDTLYNIIPYGTSFKDVTGVGAVLLVDAFAKKINKVRVVMFDKAIETLTDDDDVVTEVTLYEGKTKKTLYTDDEQITNTLKQFKRGDLFRYAIDTKGYIVLIEKLFDVQERKVVDGINANVNNTNADLRFVFADVYEKNNGIIRITSVFENNSFSVSSAPNVMKNDLLELHNVGMYDLYAGIAVYDEEEEQIKVGTADDIKAYSENPNNYSRIFVSTSYSESRHMYIYNFE